MSVLSGLIILVVVLAAASAAGLAFRARQGRFHGSGQAAPSTASPSVLTADELGAALGERATLVQFSTEFCAYCGPTRQLLTEVAGERDGVSFVEIDAAERMDLTRRLGVLATPTILLLGPGGTIESRASGKPRKPELLAAVGAVLGPDGGS
jgi:thiol-disulfide isomerase/thioredoxin